MGQSYVIMTKDGPVAGRVPSARISKECRYEHGHPNQCARQSTPTMHHLPPRAVALPPTNPQEAQISTSSEFPQRFSHSASFAQQGKHLPSLVMVLTLP